MFILICSIMVNSLTTRKNCIQKYNLRYLLKFNLVCTLICANTVFQFCLKLTSMVRPSDRVRNSLMYINIFANCRNKCYSSFSSFTNIVICINMEFYNLPLQSIHQAKCPASSQKCHVKHPARVIRTPNILQISVLVTMHCISVHQRETNTSLLPYSYYKIVIIN